MRTYCRYLPYQPYLHHECRRRLVPNVDVRQGPLSVAAGCTHDVCSRVCVIYGTLLSPTYSVQGGSVSIGGFVFVLELDVTERIRYRKGEPNLGQHSIEPGFQRDSLA